MGKGIFAGVDLILDSDETEREIFDFLSVKDRLMDSTDKIPLGYGFRFKNNHKTVSFNSYGYWTAYLNHSPPSKQSICFNSDGKLHLIKLVLKGQQLMMDYRIIGWINSLTGKNRTGWIQLISNRSNNK